MSPTEEKVKIETLFPIPLYKTFREIKEKEIKFIEKNKQAQDNFETEKRFISSDHYILNNEELKDLKNDLNFIINDYFNKIFGVDENNLITPYITQSWLNWTKLEGFHHKHYHSNSIISGVVYINADEKYDSIVFETPFKDFFRITYNDSNIFSKRSMMIPVSTGMIILFPSWLSHGVNLKFNGDIRTSLAFNVFIKGTIGLDMALTELKL
jgi:uncharacterized protein (TIGR02466 family)